MKNKQGTYEKIVKMLRNDDYTTSNLSNYLHHQNYYVIITIDLSRYTYTTIHQQINFVETWEEDNDAALSFIVEKQQRPFEAFV